MSYRDIVAGMSTSGLNQQTVKGPQPSTSRLRIKVGNKTVVSTGHTVAAAQRCKAASERPLQLAQGELAEVYGHIMRHGFPVTRGGADPPDLPTGNTNPVPEIEPAEEQPPQHPPPAVGQHEVTDRMEISEVPSEQGEGRTWFQWVSSALQRRPQLPAVSVPARRVSFWGVRRPSDTPRVYAGSDAGRSTGPGGYDISPDEYALILREHQRSTTPH